ncbi:MAG: ORF6N domain-containing protein [Nitrospira sp.]|nr:MAG: ORF6N domain-containing protein [Nitrospira sp.]
MSALAPRGRIEQTILLIRGHNVMLDSDLAQLYGVTVGRLNEAIKRNEDRFPGDFMFQLTQAEFEHLKSQIAISSSTWGGRRHAPYVFTEQGVAMLSSVLRSKRAIEVNIAIMRTFVRLRERRGWSLMIFCARATRGRRLPSLNARSGRSISPHP